MLWIKIVAFAAVFLAIIAVMAWQARLEDLTGRRRSALFWLGASVPAGLLAGALAWFCVDDPTLFFHRRLTQGLGPNWVCPNDVAPPAMVCFRR